MCVFVGSSIRRKHNFVLFFEAESVSCGVQEPWVVVGTLHAGVQPQSLSRQLPGGQRARVGQ